MGGPLWQVTQSGWWYSPSIPHWHQWVASLTGYTGGTALAGQGHWWVGLSDRLHWPVWQATGGWGEGGTTLAGQWHWWVGQFGGGDSPGWSSTSGLFTTVCLQYNWGGGGGGGGQDATHFPLIHRCGCCLREAGWTADIPTPDTDVTEGWTPHHTELWLTLTHYCNNNNNNKL